mmetsp:Transcript_109/g.290  ORF Transcript_109/g.290 Transcript_109/m.290 type:complete len:359 (-) Transcript_109:977-2053(-)
MQEGQETQARWWQGQGRKGQGRKEGIVQAQEPNREHQHQHCSHSFSRIDGRFRRGRVPGRNLLLARQDLQARRGTRQWKQWRRQQRRRQWKQRRRQQRRQHLHPSTGPHRLARPHGLPRADGHAHTVPGTHDLAEAHDLPRSHGHPHPVPGTHDHTEPHVHGEPHTNRRHRRRHRKQHPRPGQVLLHHHARGIQRRLHRHLVPRNRQGTREGGNGRPFLGRRRPRRREGHGRLPDHGHSQRPRRRIGRRRLRRRDLPGRGDHPTHGAPHRGVPPQGPGGRGRLLLGKQELPEGAGRGGGESLPARRHEELVLCQGNVRRRQPMRRQVHHTDQLHGRPRIHSGRKLDSLVAQGIPFDDG